jgi:predicted transcriptional regulator
MGGSKRGRGRHDKNQALLFALRHQLRRQIMQLMLDGREASPSQIAKELDARLSSVAYHVRVLAECGALKATVNEKVRGATKHFYRCSMEAEWAQEMLEEDED